MTSVDLFGGESCCGPAADDVQAKRAAARFVVDSDWLASQGITVRRVNILSDPAAFMGTPAIAELLTSKGMDALPVVMVDGQVRCSGRYPDRSELANWCGLPEEGSAHPGEGAAAERSTVAAATSQPRGEAR